MAEQKLDQRGRREGSRSRHPARAVKPARRGSVNYVADWVMDAVNDLVGRFDQDIVVETIDRSGAARRRRTARWPTRWRRRATNSASAKAPLVAMTPDGVVRALVGGRNYAESQFNRAIAAKRQPGSAFKPFVYLTALEHGLTPDTVREDAPIVGEGLEAGKFRARISWGR